MPQERYLTFFTFFNLAATLTRWLWLLFAINSGAKEFSM